MWWSYWRCWPQRRLILIVAQRLSLAGFLFYCIIRLIIRLYTMDCGTIKIKDFINLWAKDEVECWREVEAMRMVLSFAMPYFYSLPWFEVREEIDVSWDAFQTQYPIYHVMWFYAEKSCACSCSTVCNQCSTCFIEDENCWLCDSGFGKLKMNNTFGMGKLRTWNYYLLCPNGKDVAYMLPQWISKAYIHYRKDITSFSDVEGTIDLPPYLYGVLGLLVKYFTRKDWTEARRRADFESSLEKLHYIYSPDTPSSLKFINKDIPRKFN